MSLQTYNIDDFSGGLNDNDSPHAIQPNELTVAQDVLFDMNGRIRRRGAFSYVSGVAANITDTLICANRHAYNSDSKGILWVTTDGTDTDFWFRPDGGSIVNFLTMSGVVATRGQIFGGFSANRVHGYDSVNNISIIVTNVGTIGFKYDDDGIYPDIAPGSAPGYRYTKNDGTEDITAVYRSVKPDQNQFTLDSGKIEITYIAGSGTLSGYNIDGSTSRSGINPVLGNAKFAFGVSTDTFSWLSGESKHPQRLHFSGARERDFGGQDSNLWDQKDNLHIPSQPTQRLTGLAVVGSKLAIMKESELHVLIPDADVTKFQQRFVSDASCLDYRSIAYHKNGCIFAGHNGVWAFDGNSINKLSNSIENSWNAAISGFNRSNMKLVGGVIQNHYVVTIINSSGRSIAAFCCNLDTGAWSTLTNFHFHEIFSSIDGLETWGFYKVPTEGTSEVGSFVPMRLDPLFTQPISTGNDAYGAGGPNMMIETGRLDLGDMFRQKHFRSVLLSYRTATTSGSPALKMKIVPSLSVDTNYSTLDTLSFPAATVGYARKFFDKRTSALGLRIEEDRSGGDFSSILINGIQLLFKPMRPGRPS